MSAAAGHCDAPAKLVGALVAGIRIIRYLNASGEPVGVTRISRDLRINASTCFNLLRTLAYEGLIVFDPAAKTYSPGLGLMELARGNPASMSYARLAEPELRKIASAHDVTATLWQYTGSNRVVLIDFVESNGAIRVRMSIGQRLPWNVAALGRCFMAHAGLSQGQLRAAFRTLRWQNPPSFEDYLADIADAKENGYAIDAENYVKGVTTISSLVFGRSAKPIMAISAVGFSANLTGSTLERVAADVRDATRRLSLLVAE